MSVGDREALADEKSLSARRSLDRDGTADALARHALAASSFVPEGRKQERLWISVRRREPFLQTVAIRGGRPAAPFSIGPEIGDVLQDRRGLCEPLAIVENQHGTAPFADTPRKWLSSSMTFLVHSAPDGSAPRCRLHQRDAAGERAGHREK